jgi:two-component system phosphate regulon response regulator PhoB
VTAATACVVVIDANAHMRRLIKTLLGALPGASVVEAGTTRAATPLIRAHTPRLIIMDWTSAPIDGVLFVHQLRRGQIGRPDTPILALSNTLNPAILEQAEAAGVDDVIAKPISAVEMLHRAATLIARHHRGPANQAAE